MKKTSFITLLLLAVMPVFATHVDPTTAQKAATNFLNNNGVKTDQLIDLSHKTGFPNLYIFNAEKGFVVMAADDRVKPILGYSLTGRFEANDMPENLVWWLQGYNNQIQYFIDNQIKSSAESAQRWKELLEGPNGTIKTTTVVEPLIQTQWNQNSPYNNLCPSGTVTGCVATAMAQVMKYWNYPAHGMGSHSYIPINNPSLGEQFADFNSTYYDWGNMANTYDNTSTTAQQQAVATLMYHCGVSVNMKYGSTSNASTGEVANSLKTFFNYSPDIQWLERNNYSDNEWIGMLKSDLDQNRPIQYAGKGNGEGHSFLCDGYDSNNYFHFNWGWGGKCDAYYSVDNLNPGPGGIGSGSYGIYNDNQGAIFGIHPSECTSDEPSGLTYTQNGREVTFNWTSATGAVSYNIYRNGNYIGNSTATTYNETAPYGNNTYYVRSVDSEGNLSLSSNTVNVIVDYQIPVVNDLEGVLSDNDISLSWTTPEWCFPQTESSILTYGDGTSGHFTGYGGTQHMYWGHRYLPSDLAEASDKLIFRVSFFVRETGVYELNIFEGTTIKTYTNASYDIPVTLLTNKTITATQTGWFAIDLEEPVVLDPTQDLWVMMYDPEYKQMPAEYCLFNEHERGGYLSTDIAAWTYSEGGYAFLIRTYLTDGTYTYNLYQDGVKIAENLSETNYNASLNNNAPNLFTVKTNYYGGETSASNMIGVAVGSTSIGTLNLDSNDAMTVTNGSALTVTGSITNTNPANLVIEDGAQLIHPSGAVTATLKKTILPYSSGQNDGWYTIASPVDNAAVSLITNGSYDLYAYDEKEVLWLNQKTTAHNITAFSEGHGFLYANATEQPLAFAGNMKATAEQVTVPLSYQSDNTNLKGYNLVGNPFTRNLVAGDITIGGDPLTTYYIVEGGSQLEARALADYPIKPGQGFLVQANAENQNLVFNPNSRGETAAKSAYISIEVGDENFTDRAYVQFGQGNNLHKMTLTENTSMLSVRYDNADYAAVTIDKPEGELPINFKAEKNGTYTLTVSESLNSKLLILNYLHLIDNLTGTDIDLLATPSYTFEAKTDDYASRFKLVFNPNSDTNENNDIFVNGKGVIIDMTGRVVATEPNTKLAPGVYILRTVNGDETNNQKIIIK